MRVLIRADASAIIGSGHVVRCLTLAEALRVQGADVEFISRRCDGDLIEFVIGKGFPLHVLKPLSDVSQVDDARETLSVISTDEKIDWLVVDHYGIDRNWQQFLRPHVKRIMVIDDLANRDHDCDLLLDQSLCADMVMRYLGRVPDSCKKLIGPKFGLLQPEYAQLHRKSYAREEGPVRVFGYLGAADRMNISDLILKVAENLQHMNVMFDVVVNSGHPHWAALRARAERLNNVSLHSNLPSLAPLMAQADVAIGAAGTTALERVFFELPSIVITLAENQTHVARELDRRKLAKWIGDDSDVTVEKLQEALVSYIEKMPHWLRENPQLVDGLGCNRVCAILLSDVQPPLYLRPADANDEALLLEWTNEAETRRNAFHQALITEGDHERWFRDRLLDVQNSRIYVLEMDSVPVGQIRFDRHDVQWIISYSIAVEFRGQGLGKRIVPMAMRELIDELGNSSFIAKIKPFNQPSRRIFERLGFTLIEQSATSLTFENAE